MTWIPHTGQGMPVDGETLVSVKLRNGKAKNKPFKARFWDWKFGWGSLSVSRFDIIAYRIHTPSTSHEQGEDK